MRIIALLATLFLTAYGLYAIAFENNAAGIVLVTIGGFSFLALVSAEDRTHNRKFGKPNKFRRG